MRIFQGKEFTGNYLNRVFADSRLGFTSVVVKRNITIQKENSANYQGFLKPAAINMAKKFAGKWRTSLKNASKQFGVDKDIIIALLLVESNCGKNTGKEIVMNVFTSIILENQGNRRKEYERELKDHPHKDKYLKRLQTKAKWAKNELKALLVMKKEKKIKIHELKGSYAGAFGIPQFLPSSYLKWGYSGDKNSKIDLFFMPDAIYSVVNYLKAHGWKNGLTRKSKQKVLFSYNRSKAYVDAIMQIARKLKEMSPDTPKPG